MRLLEPHQSQCDLCLLRHECLEGTALTEKDLKKLNRYQLLELLILQTERADKLQDRVEELEKKLKHQDLKIASLGSIAEASLQLGGVFQAAQEAADIYLNTAKERAKEIEEAARAKAERIEANAIELASILNVI
jgi:cell division septum initiation protein DivIVA